MNYRNRENDAAYLFPQTFEAPKPWRPELTDKRFNELLAEVDAEIEAQGHPLHYGGYQPFEIEQRFIDDLNKVADEQDARRRIDAAIRRERRKAVKPS